jgi:hypothetical protein
MPLSALSVPTERAAPPKDLEVRPKQAKAWIDGLPIAQPLEAARKLAAYLASVNRAKVGLEDRIAILDAARPMSTTILDELDAVYGKSGPPHGQKARDALGAARSLLAELASGYKSVIVEAAGKALAFGAKKQMPLLVLRAIEYLFAQQRAAYKSYTPVPAGLWNELHHLYLFADKHKFAADPADPETKSTVMDGYTEALLLSLTDPYKLVPGEADRVIAQMRGSRGMVTLGQARPATKPSGHFLVPCDTDKPPKPMLSANEEAGGPNWRLLDTNLLVDKIRTRKQAVETGNVSQTTSKSLGPEGVALLGKLVTLWGDPPKRAHRRDPIEEMSVALCIGLKAIGHYVSASSAAAQAEAEVEAIARGTTVPLLIIPDDETSRQLPVHEWEVVNQSEGGLKVRRTGNSVQGIGVGEAIGIKWVGRPYWTIAVARWITVLDDGGMEFGLQYFAPAVSSFWVQYAMSASPQAKQGVLLADGREAMAGESLLAPLNTYAELREFELQGEDGLMRVRAAGLIEKTGRFELFHVSQI